MSNAAQRRKARRSDPREMRRRINELEIQVSLLEQKTDAVTAERDRLKRERDEALTRAELSAEIHFGLKSENDRLEARISDLVAGTDELNEELSSWREQSETYYERWSEAREKAEDYDRLKKEHDRMERRLRSKDERAARAAGYREVVRQRTGDDRFREFVRKVADLTLHPSDMEGAAGAALAIRQQAKKLVGLME